MPGRRAGGRAGLAAAGEVRRPGRRERPPAARGRPGSTRDRPGAGHGARAHHPTGAPSSPRRGRRRPGHVPAHRRRDDRRGAADGRAGRDAARGGRGRAAVGVVPDRARPRRPGCRDAGGVRRALPALGRRPGPPGRRAQHPSSAPAHLADRRHPGVYPGRRSGVPGSIWSRWCEKAPTPQPPLPREGEGEPHSLDLPSPCRRGVGGEVSP